MTFSRKVTCPYCGHADRIPAEQFSGALMGDAIEQWVNEGVSLPCSRLRLHHLVTATIDT